MSDAAVIASPGVRSPLREFWNRLRRRKVALISAALLLLLVLSAVFAPWVAPS